MESEFCRRLSGSHRVCDEKKKTAPMAVKRVTLMCFTHNNDDNHIAVEMCNLLYFLPPASFHPPVFQADNGQRNHKGVGKKIRAKKFPASPAVTGEYSSLLLLRVRPFKKPLLMAVS